MLIQSILAASLAFSAQGDAPAVPALQKVALTDQADSSAKSEEELKDEDERVCRRVSVLGTRMKKKVCASRKEWDEMAESSRQSTGNNRRRSQSSGNGIEG
ncbi:MAG: hypothetical protein ABJ205_11690 [Erythrobacter sp.]|uniref:hypothetical protein n=1 Tax=Erythrobacter sp. TaxID=1042 RepID=UPI003263D43A